MGVTSPEKAQILFAEVAHVRTMPKKNRFAYGIYYLSLPLSQLKNLPLPYNRFGALSFYDRDHGSCDGSSLEDWARGHLKAHNIPANGDITLICMARVLGYVFNPVSFWLCHDKGGNLRAVLCEVHNTFGEHHTYICAHDDHRPITADDVIEGQKLFHVSPFIEREGHYKFRFHRDHKKFMAQIDLYDADNRKLLATSLRGRLVNMDKQSLRKAFWRYPLVTFKAIGLIHWQAIKLLGKGIKYRHKPKQLDQKSSKADRTTGQ